MGLGGFCTMAAGAISRHAAGAVQLALQDLISDASRGNKNPLNTMCWRAFFCGGGWQEKFFKFFS